MNGMLSVAPIGGVLPTARSKLAAFCGENLSLLECRPASYVTS
jgi:hypothetical protein